MVLCGGANDIAKNNSKEGLRHISNFVNNNTHTNIVMQVIPYRHDLVSWSCINKEVTVFNRKLLKIMKGHEHVTVTNYYLDRQLFTKHGMHLNKTGKEMVTKHIAAMCIKILQTKQNIIPISMSWKEFGNHKVSQETDKSLVMKDSENGIEEKGSVSRKLRKAPAKLSEDFLWIHQSKKELKKKEIK